MSMAKLSRQGAEIYLRFFNLQPAKSPVCQSLPEVYIRFFETANQSSITWPAPVDQSAVVQRSRPFIPETAVSQEPAAQDYEAPGLLQRLKAGMKKTRLSLAQGLSGLLSQATKFDSAFFDELEAQLIMADVGISTTQDIIEQLKTFAKTQEQTASADQIRAELKKRLVAILPQQQVVEVKHKPEMILVVGVNGVGKTTTIGKLAHQAKQSGKSVMLAAGDTFRAAAVEQLQIWGQRIDVPVISQDQGADSASVIYDAFESARAKGTDLLIADTAGRLHNKSNLMKELQKIVRVIQKKNPDAPHRILLVVDGCTGQNALAQGREFNEAVPLTGLVITKLDGTAKGGIVFALSQSLGVPVEYIGIGEGPEDLRAFDGPAYVDAILDLD